MRPTWQLDKTTQATARYCTSNFDCDGRTNETCYVDTSAGKVVDNQCVGKTCATAADCAACQTCTNLVCQQPSATDACLTTGL